MSIIIIIILFIFINLKKTSLYCIIYCIFIYYIIMHNYTGVL